MIFLVLSSCIPTLLCRFLCKLVLVGRYIVCAVLPLLGRAWPFYPQDGFGICGRNKNRLLAYSAPGETLLFRLAVSLNPVFSKECLSAPFTDRSFELRCQLSRKLEIKKNDELFRLSIGRAIVPSPYFFGSAIGDEIRLECFSSRPYPLAGLQFA